MPEPRPTPIVLIALRAREWRQARTLVVMGLAITGVATLATFLHLDLFHLDSGPFSARSSAWTWLVVYVAIPPMAWLLTIALGCWWSLRENDWRRIRVAFPGYFTFAALALIGAEPAPPTIPA